MTIKAIQKAVVLLMLCGPAIATPWTPTDKDQILETLPVRLGGGAIDNQQLRDKLTNQPKDPQAVVALAQEYITESRRTSDPRFLGYADTLLSPWANAAQVPSAIRLSRAIIAQRNHHFAKALQDLHAVLQADPQNTEALLTLATVQTVRADFTDAQRVCRSLLSLNTLLLGVVCQAQIQNQTGKARQALNTLVALNQTQNAMVSPGVKEWLLLTQADSAIRLGEHKLAEASYLEALQAPDVSAEALVAYADWLLDAGRYQEVIDRLTGQESNDGLLLRLAIAEEKLLSGKRQIHIDELGARFDAAHLRGDRVHLREEARFQLQLRRNPQTALLLAQENWNVQREPADLRILLESAIAAKDTKTITAAKHWLQLTGLQEPSINRLLSSGAEARS